jgi:hypothetical protein
VFLVLSAGVSVARAAHPNVACTHQSQGGTCDYIVNISPTGMTKIESPAWKPGDRVCLRAGNYPQGRLYIWGVTGSATAPIEIINCGGQVVIGNSIDGNGDGQIDFSHGIEMNRTRYVKISGAGSANHLYGIKLAGTKMGLAGLSFADLSSDMEAEFIEVTRSGFAGIMAKTDPGCTDTNPTSFRGGFVMRNANFHDNYIHDLVGGEGFYIGYSFFQGYTSSKCPNVKVFSHPVVNTKVYRNRLENTPCEAIQIGIGENSEVFDNYIRGFGVSPFASYQNNGIQIGAGSSGKIYNNFISKNTNATTGHGITLSNWKDTLVYGNTLVGGGIYVHHKASQNVYGQYEPYTLRLANNTIINTIPSDQNRGIWNGNSVMKLYIANNLIQIANPISSTGLTSQEHLTVNAIYDETISLANREKGLFSPNLTVVDNHRGLYSAEQAAHFVNAAGGDYRLKSSSVAVNAGTDVSSLGVAVAMKVDHVNRTVASAPRLAGSSIDIGAFENANQAPSLSFSPASLTLKEGTVQYFTVFASDADGDPVAFTEVSRPGFITFVSSTATSRKYKVAPVMTTVSAQQTFQFKIRASDPSGASTEKAMSITVQNY